MKYTIAHFDRALEMRERNVPWKLIEREMPGIQSAWGNYKFRHKHANDILTTRKKKGLHRPPAVRTRACRLHVYGQYREGQLVVTERRIRVCANAYYGLPLESGLCKTESSRQATHKTIGLLRRKGLIFDSTLTSAGLAYLNLIVPKDQRR